MLRAKRQSFFKVFLLQHSARRMKIPPKYRGHMNGKNSGTVYLMGPGGNRWGVKLIEESGGLYLARGWPTFVKDHAIQQWHFLVFKFNGVDTFKVKIYSPTGCEEKASYHAKPSWGGDTNPIKQVKGHAPEVKEEEEDAWNSTVTCLLPAPSAAAYPNFVVKLKADSVRDPSQGMAVGIPSSFFRTHMSHLAEQSMPITLRWVNKEWPASVIRTNGRSYLSGGWRDFVKESRVRAGDSCRFELLKRHLLRVHIFKISKIESPDRSRV